MYFCCAQSQRDGVDEQVFKVSLGGGFEQPDLVQEVPIHGEQGGLDDL